MYDSHISTHESDPHGYFQDIPIMRQAFPIRRERSKPHLSQPAVAKCLHQAVLSRCLITNSFLCPQGCNTPHEVGQDPPAKVAMPSRMSQLSTSQGGGGDSLQAGNPPSEGGSNSLSSSRGVAQEPPAPPSIASVITTPAETEQPRRACPVVQDATVDPVSVLTSVSSTAPQVALTVRPESPQSTTSPTQSTANPSTSLSGKWLCPLHPPPSALDPQSLTLPLKRERRAIRSQKECVHWFRSNGNDNLRSPPDSRSAYDSPLQIADLYIHQNNRESVRQIWMWTGHRWDTVAPDCTHPTMSNYRLRILDKGEPSWVTRKTMVSDQGREKWKLEK
ncbi:hypothetical protein PISMIDRAFT_25429 [Pisolithus microcarpus 441]|uniref:Uncharacterized protein n=1 Tax=Pisolithus microcarpus 441 TaxID=765257 RepID=A0A0C9YVP2_9AGAM|nr:hypothetical protein BKA83DRAFT_25429 [Pisolithus microcarpus]KAI6036753.1 hypothetical protein BKA83DRAFT_4120439 [Pisolithus microcarpus]KIK14257.1 hypothetical protein PISMIDRAFT_25429 [Pisolithus microcarpus 441]